MGGCNFRFMRQILHFSILVSSVALLIGCDTAKEELGLNRRVPDEFQVIKRAPLSQPPNYALRPPAPGAPRPQELETAETAEQVVFGDNAGVVVTSNSEDLLLRQAGAGNADPNIRRVVDSETAEFVGEEKPVIDKLLDFGGSDAPQSSVVDAPAELERLRSNVEAGRPVTDGETPSKIQ